MENRMANRQVCDVDIRDFKTNEPFLWLETANTSSFSTSADTVFAMGKGAKRVDFQNPLESTIALEFQVMPFRMFAMLSDGTFSSSAVYTVHEKITCATAGKVTITPKQTMTVQAGTVFVYPEGEFGVEDSKIAGTFSSNDFTATETTDIAVGSVYEVGYIVTRTGVKNIQFNSGKKPKTYAINMSTLFKDEQGQYIPVLIKVYKATLQRNFEMSFSSEGDPVTITFTFDCLDDPNGNQVEMIELTDDIA